MRKIIIILFIVVCGDVCGQVNLVPNYSFETYDTCGGLVNYATPWHSVNSSPDYLNSCESVQSFLNVPDAGFGWQYARTGSAYVGFATNTYSQIANDREYIQVKLDSLLIQNHNYCIGFYVSLANGFNIATNNTGMYISDTPPPPPPPESVYANLTPQINATVPITDTAGWTLISGQYTAHGGEQYITIGNFYTDAQTDTVRVANQPGGDGSYYYIDDVSLVDCTQGLGVQELEIKNEELGIEPNPANASITLTLTKGEGIKRVYVFNVLGVLVYSTSFNNFQTTIDVSTYSNGVYFVQVQTEKGVVRKKFVKE